MVNFVKPAQSNSIVSPVIVEVFVVLETNDCCESVYLHNNYNFNEENSFTFRMFYSCYCASRFKKKKEKSKSVCLPQHSWEVKLLL